MKSLLVALIVHLINQPASLGAPFYVVPAQMFGSGPGEPLKLTTSDTFGDLERRKWESVIAVAGSPKVAAELCYRSAYVDMHDGVVALKPAERDDFLIKAGGYHVLARVAVRWCNNSLKKLDIVPLSHPEFTEAERAVRQKAYLDDVAYLRSCTSERCVKEAPASFAREVVGIPLDAAR